MWQFYINDGCNNGFISLIVYQGIIDLISYCEYGNIPQKINNYLIQFFTEFTWQAIVHFNEGKRCKALPFLPTSHSSKSYCQRLKYYSLWLKHLYEGLLKLYYKSCKDHHTLNMPPDWGLTPFAY